MVVRSNRDDSSPHFNNTLFLTLPPLPVPPFSPPTKVSQIVLLECKTSLSLGDGFYWLLLHLIYCLHGEQHARGLFVICYQRFYEITPSFYSCLIHHHKGRGGDLHLLFQGGNANLFVILNTIFSLLLPTNSTKSALEC